MDHQLPRGNGKLNVFQFRKTKKRKGKKKHKPFLSFLYFPLSFLLFFFCHSRLSLISFSTKCHFFSLSPSKKTNPLLSCLMAFIAQPRGLDHGHSWVGRGQHGRGQLVHGECSHEGAETCWQVRRGLCRSWCEHGREGRLQTGAVVVAGVGRGAG